MTFAAPRPPYDTWVVSVHRGTPHTPPVGTGFLISPDTVLTCDHVVRAGWGTDERLWVAAPKSGRPTTPRVTARVLVPAEPPDPALDVALLRLAEALPADWVAPLRVPEPEDLLGSGWWAFGFPHQDPLGNSAGGTVGAVLGDGWLRLDTESRYPVRTGFSGAAVWSARYGAVIGFIGHANPANGDARALTLARVARALPDALAPRWSLAHDPQAARHWLPQARGVGDEAERGFRFHGRAVALTEITELLDDPSPAQGVLLVTGSPGVGKSAVLSRVVTTSDPEYAATLPPSDTAARARTGSVDCAVHVKGKTALEVAHEIARAASARLPETVEELASAVRDALERQKTASFSVVIDALDEAAGPQEARAVAAGVVLPLVHGCADLGVRVVVGSRPWDAAGDLLAAFGPGARRIALDEPRYFEEEDLVAYALASLRPTGGERPGSPYDDERTAHALARRIAAVARGNFLIAGLVARTHGLHDDTATAPDELSVPATVHEALRAYVARVPDVDDVPAPDVLTVLAYAQVPGLPIPLWQAALAALFGHTVRADALAAFTRRAAANFLIESDAAEDGAAGTASFQLFHQALSEALLAERDSLGMRERDERAVARALLDHGRRHGWADAPAYLLHALPDHAARTGLLDELLAQDAYPLHADLGRLVPQAARGATSPAARDRARLLRLTPQAADAGPPMRAALFGVTELLEHLGDDYRRRQVQDAPYRALWSDISPRPENAVLTGPTRPLRALCAVPTPERTLLAGAAWDHTVRLWDPLTGGARHTLRGGSAAVCAVAQRGRTMLAGLDVGGAVRLWDPLSGAELRVLEGGSGHGQALAAVTLPDGHALLAGATSDGRVRLWDPGTGHMVHSLPTARRNVGSLQVLPQPDRQPLLASVEGDHRQGRVVSVWDPVTGALLDRFDAGPGGERTAVPLPLPGRTALAYHSGDRTIGLWDPERGLVPVVVEHRQSVGRLCAVETGGRTLLAAVDDTYERHGDCVVTVPDDSRRNVIRVWDPGSGTPVSSLDCAFDVGMLHAFPAGTRMLLAGASSANGGSKLAEQCLHVWDPLSGALLWRGRGDSQGIAVACSVPLADRVLLATAGASHEVRLWDPASRLADDAAYDRGPEDDLRAGVETVHRVRAGGREVLAVLNNRYLRPGDGYPAASIADLLDPQSGRRLARLRPRGNKHIDQLVAAHFAAGGVLASTAQEIDTNYPSVDLDLWRPDTGMRLATMRKGDKRLAVWGAMCAFEADGKALLAMAPGGSGDVVVLQARRKGRIVAEFRVADRQVFALAAVPYRGAPALATASFDSAVRLWEPLTGRPLGSLDHGALLDEQGGRPADVLCPIPHGAGALLATARRHRGTVLLWDVETGALRARLACHPDDGNAFAIGGLCAFPLAGRLVLATGGSERHVRLWDALRARLMLDIPVHHRVSALAYDDGLLTVGTDAGLLTLRLVPAASAFR